MNQLDVFIIARTNAKAHSSSYVIGNTRNGFMRNGLCDWKRGTAPCSLLTELTYTLTSDSEERGSHMPTVEDVKKRSWGGLVSYCRVLNAGFMC